MPQLQTTCYQQLDFFSALFLTNRHAYYKEYDTYCHTTQTHITNVTNTYRQLNAWQKKAYSTGISCYISSASEYNSGYFTSSFFVIDLSILGHLCHFLCSSESKQAEAGVPDSSELRLLTVMNVKDDYHFGGSFNKFSSKEGIVRTIPLLRRD